MQEFCLGQRDVRVVEVVINQTHEQLLSLIITKSIFNNCCKILNKKILSSLQTGHVQQSFLVFNSLGSYHLERIAFPSLEILNLKLIFAGKKPCGYPWYER